MHACGDALKPPPDSTSLPFHTVALVPWPSSAPARERANSPVRAHACPPAPCVLARTPPPPSPAVLSGGERVARQAQDERRRGAHHRARQGRGQGGEASSERQHRLYRRHG
eukprot:2036480-Pleurochrysis_carterae.AAC.3